MKNHRLISGFIFFYLYNIGCSYYSDISITISLRDNLSYCLRFIYWSNKAFYLETNIFVFCNFAVQYPQKLIESTINSKKLRKTWFWKLTRFLFYRIFIRRPHVFYFITPIKSLTSPKATMIESVSFVLVDNYRFVFLQLNYSVPFLYLKWNSYVWKLAKVGNFSIVHSATEANLMTNLGPFFPQSFTVSSLKLSSFLISKCRIFHERVLLNRYLCWINSARTPRWNNYTGCLTLPRKIRSEGEIRTTSPLPRCFK